MSFRDRSAWNDGERPGRHLPVVAGFDARATKPEYVRQVADLPVTVESVSRDRFESDTSSGFLRKTTVFSLAGDGAVGRGEDVTYDTEDHDALGRDACRPRTLRSPASTP